MRKIPFIFSIFFLALCLGCGKRFGLAQGEQQIPSNSDHYIRKYAEPRIAKLHADDPDARVSVKKVSRKGGNWVADVEVDTRGKRTRERYILDSKGRVVDELR